MAEKAIKATINVTLKPWPAPNFALRADATGEQEGVPVRELDIDTLEDMALAWVRDLYTKAGHTYVPFRKPEKDGSDYGR